MLVPNELDVTMQAQALVGRTYRQPQAVLIRSLDALHVASALAARATTLVATGERLRDVAALIGLAGLP